VGEGTWTDSRSIKVTHFVSAGKITFFRNDTDDFLQVAHFLATPLFAFVGGPVARRLFRAPKSETSTNEVP
jgi:hypothetical protein